MSYIILPSRRRSLPIRPTVPNAPGIKSAYEGWVVPGFDFVNAWTKNGTPTIGAAASGIGTYFGSGNYYSSSRIVGCGTGAGNERQYDSVWCVIFTPTSNAGNTGIFSVGSTATDGGPAILVRNNAGTINVTMAGAGSGDLATSVIGQTYCIVYIYNDVSPYNHKFFVNGVLKQTFAYYRSDSVWTGKNNYIASGYNGQFGGIVHGHFFFQPWTIGDAEASALSANPGVELFAPDVRRIYFGAGGAAGETGLVLSDAAQGHAADAVVLSAASSLAVADATHAHSAETPTIDVSTATPLTVADATQAQSSDAATLTTASSISVADATQGQSADAADLTSAHALTVADATQGQASEMPTLDTSNATPLTIADSTHGHVAGNLALLAACLLATQGATQAQQTDSVDLVTLHHLAAADATHAMSSESPTLTIPGTGTGATVEEIVAAMMAALNATAIPVNIEQVNAVPLTGVGSDGDPWRAA